MDNLTNAQAVINFAYFTANFPPKFIEDVWKDEPHLIDHFNEKLRYYLSKEQAGYVTFNVFMKWFFDLSPANMAKLINWVNENYKGFS